MHSEDSEIPEGNPPQSDLSDAAHQKAKGPLSYITGLDIDPVKEWSPSPEDYPNINRIHPLQRKKIGRLIAFLQGDPSVRKIIVFGSSVTRKCHIGSDVDVYIEMNEDHSPLCGELDFACDLWTNFTADARLKEEINRKGVTVYVN